MTKGIKLSPKHGVNPSILHCICCGKEYGIAMLGKLKGDQEAPRDISQGLCDECKDVLKQGGAMFIEVLDGETGNNPHRTGRIIGVSKAFKERNHLEHPIMYLEKSMFSAIFGKIDFK